MPTEHARPTDLIDLARVARGEVTLKLAAQDMCPVVSDVVEQLQPLIQSKRHADPARGDVTRSMKHASSKFRLACLVVLAVLSSTCSAQQNFALSEVKFNGLFGTRPGDRNLYCLLGNGFFRTISSGDETAVISDWRTRHPKAQAVPVSISGENSRMRIVYIWAVDGKDNLNLLLINKGAFPASVMLDAVQFDQLLKRSGPTPEQKSIAAGMSYARKMRQVAPAVEAPPRRLMPQPRYLAFLKDLLANENVARTQMNGIWSDKFNDLRQEEHASPLDALPLSESGIEEK